MRLPTLDLRLDIEAKATTQTLFEVVEVLAQLGGTTDRLLHPDGYCVTGTDGLTRWRRR